MDNFVERILQAKYDPKEMEQLLLDYLPFIKKQLVGLQGYGLEYEDALSLAMITFVNSAKQYEENKGNFLSFASTSIKNRLIDENRKIMRYRSHTVVVDFNEKALEEKDAKDASALYNIEMERKSLEEEISDLSSVLSMYGISFSELPKTCPKHKKARSQCLMIANELIQNEKWRDGLLSTHKLPQKELALHFSLSVKTIEKHRKYIVTLCLVLSGNYPGIKSFILPQMEGTR